MYYCFLPSTELRMHSSNMGLEVLVKKDNIESVVK